MGYLEQLGKLRKKVICKSIIIVIIFVLLYFIVLIKKNGNLEFERDFRLFLLFAILAAVFIAIFTDKNTREYNRLYKSNIVLASFHSIFTDVRYNPEVGIDPSIISNTRMMQMGDRYSSNDLISAKYKNINFVCSDIEIEEEYTDSDGDRHYTTIFLGQWFVFDFNKNFKANIQICENSFKGSKRGSLFNNNYKKVIMEDVEFNNQFKIYAENELDAFYILTPNMMERIKQLNNSVHGNLLFCLIDNKMHIGLHNCNDLFEPNILKKIDLTQEKEKILRDIRIITNFIDMLELDNDLFKRRD